MKSLTRTFRSAALSLATILFAVGPALAASTAASPATMQLMSTNAQLNHALNSSRISLGQRVTAHLTMELRTDHGMVLPRNTQLIGKVSQLQRGHNKTTRVSLVFSEARLKNGHVVPIKATLLGAMPPADGFYSGESQYFPDTSHPVSPKEKIDQEAGVLNNVSLQAAVLSHVSGTFLSKRGKIRLPAGTQLRIAIAPVHPSASMAG